MDIRKIAEQNLILETITGSTLYGTNTSSSDIDYIGVFFEPFEYILSPFKSVNEVDLSIKSKLENGKNSTDAVDKKLYSMRNFVKLALQCNPNIIEVLFSNQCTFINEYGKMLQDNAHLFLHKGLADKFIGYALSQEKKMYTKSQYVVELQNLYDTLTLCKDVRQKFNTTEISKVFKTTKITHNINNIEDVYLVADIKIPNGVIIKEVIERVKERLDLSTNRKDLILNKGYDYKFGSHVIRLLEEGKQLLTEGCITFPLNNKELILDIKNGKYSVNEMKEIINEYRQRFTITEISSTLAYRPRTIEVEQLVYRMQEKFYNIIIK